MGAKAKDLAYGLSYLPAAPAGQYFSPNTS